MYPVTFLMVFCFLIPGFFLCKGKIEYVILYSCLFYYSNILLINLTKLNIKFLITIIFVEIISFLIFNFKNTKIIKIPKNLYNCISFVILISIIMGFFLPYFNFSDAMYHYSFLRKILTEQKFINFSPFYGSEFYDIRYSYSFVIPLYSFFVKLLNNIFSLNSSIRYVWNSSSIFVYILSVLSWFICIKSYYGKKTAKISIFVFTILFFGISSDLWNGLAFSLSIYPLSFALFIMLPIILYVLKQNNRYLLIILGFVLSGIHIFYALLFLFHIIIYSLIKKRYFYIFCYILGILPITMLKFYNFNIQNEFFNNITSISYNYLFKHSMNGVSGYINVILFFVFMIFYKIFKKRKFIFYLYIASIILILITPLFSKIITLNSQKLLRIYQIIPPVLYFSPVFLIFYKRMKKTIIFVFIVFLLITTFNLTIKSNKSTLKQALAIEKILINADLKGKILCDPSFSMLITSFTSAYAISVLPEYSAPSVKNIYERQKAYDMFLQKGEIIFECDYVLILPEHKIFAEKYKNKINIGKDFYLIDLKKGE